MALSKRLTREEFWQFVRFVIVGCTAAGIHYGAYCLLRLWIPLNVAYTAGYCIALVCNFFLTTYFTFRGRPSTGKVAGFGLSHLVNYLLHMVLFNLFLRLGVPELIAPILVLMIAVPTNYLLLHLFFTPRGKDQRK